MVDSEKPTARTLTAGLQKPATKQKISLFDTNMTDEDHNPPTGRYDHLPEIPPPKILQTPYKIPALFPFNRTSVYLLMSEEKGRIPKSLVLRASSEHGPLELEIPISVLSDKGETIHQLAARKAVQELEEGRGWIYEARDKNGKLLKEKYEGRKREHGMGMTYIKGFAVLSSGSLTMGVISHSSTCRADRMRGP